MFFAGKFRLEFLLFTPDFSNLCSACLIALMGESVKWESNKHACQSLQPSSGVCSPPLEPRLIFSSQELQPASALRFVTNNANRISDARTAGNGPFGLGHRNEVWGEVQLALGTLLSGHRSYSETRHTRDSTYCASNPASFRFLKSSYLLSTLIALLLVCRGPPVSDPICSSCTVNQNTNSGLSCFPWARFFPQWAFFVIPASRSTPSRCLVW
jgi:hypothetical protein